jgi:cytochrome P450
MKAESETSEFRVETMATATQARSCPFSGYAASDFDPFDISDPFDFYGWARAQAPVFFSEALQYYVVARHADIKAVFEDWETFSSENAQAPLRPIGPEARSVMRDGGFTAYSGLSARVPPEHTRIRRMVQRCFGPRRFKAIEPQIREIVRKTLDGIAESGHADFFRDFAYDVPALVLFKLVGVPDSDVAKVKAWAVSRSLLTWGNLSDAEQIPHAQNMVAYWDYCRALVAARHSHLSDDLPSDLVRLQQDGAEISDDEIAGVLYSVLFAGHETTTTLIANGVRELLLHRNNWLALVDDPALIPNAVEEILRYSPSIVAWRRKALKDATIGGTAIPAGANILLLLGSANRDETVFAEPKRFDITREDARNYLSFGYGIHFCAGQQLAKIELGVVLEELSRRLPSLRLSPNQTFEFVRNTSFRVPAALHVEWDAPQARQAATP